MIETLTLSLLKVKLPTATSNGVLDPSRNNLYYPVFGSYAKGNAVKGSDVDMLVICKKKIDVSRIAHDVSAIYGREINAMALTKEEVDKQKCKPIILEIMRSHVTCLGFREFSDMINSFSEK